ncbi:hypothetical protein PLEOSDRAFT_1092914 [Pleurotus ostreatus PC15]|uniref:1-alkyl-2-acetylglycerophosphocholine esterase n=1 Tax=Pleurotus ostreatus (strain PC15) TaxID=1137138 RepID=A0A067P0B8_PLEO1|nr:hypothetical protein PLEOSDRAFT_1092914 [Pleurotus ostreatus PC15]
MPFLDEPKDGHPVGATTFAVRVSPSKVIGNARLNNEPALHLEEVAFTAYYPAGPATRRKGMPWLLRPLNESLRGFVHFGRVSSWLIWPLIYCFGAFIKVPVYTDAPLLRPPKLETKQTQWPLVLFSHGLGGSRTAYSQICTRLAASGKVVLALEHRDGTGHVCIPRSQDETGRLVPHPKRYIRENDISWEPDDSPKDQAQPLSLRTEQLAFRTQEIYIAYKAFAKLANSGNNGHSLENIDGAPVDWESWGPGYVNCTSDVTLAGHSFGGCTVLSILSTEPPPGHPRVPVTKALVLDPWLEPLPTPGPSPYSSATLANAIESVNSASASASTLHHDSHDSDNRDVAHAMPSVHHQKGEFEQARSHPRILVINSERFTLWKDHFSRLQDVIKEWEPRGESILTIIRAEHQSFSDFPVLPLLRNKTSRMIMQLIANLSISFLDGSIEHTVETLETREMEAKVIGTKPDGSPKRQLIGDAGDVIIH